MVITGKPISMGGSLGRETATAMGAFFCTETIIPKLKKYKKKPTVAIQGFGNAGSILANLLFNAGYKVVAVSDSKGAVYCDGTVSNLVNHERLTNEELLELDVDILIPAALENQITEKNADKIKAELITSDAIKNSRPSIR